jgi:hypothetical protein
MATVKAFVRAANKKGFAPINIKYTHKSEWFPTPTGLLIEPEAFDGEYGWVRPHHPQAVVMNEVIRTYKDHLLAVAELFFVRRGQEPTAGDVKQKFNEQFLDKRSGHYIFPNTQSNFSTDESYVKTTYQDGFEEVDLTEKGKVQAEQLHKSRILARDNISNFVVTPKVSPTRKRSSKVTKPEEEEFLRLLRQYADDPNVVYNTRKNNQQLRRLLIEFSQAKQFKLAFDSINLDFYRLFGDYLLKEKGFFNNTFGARIKHLKCFLKHCEVDLNIKVNPQYKSKKFKIMTEEKHIVYFTPSEIDVIWHHSPSKPHLQKIRDLLVFGCLTGLRISDIKKSQFNVEEGILYTKTKKTKGQVMLPVHLDERILLILEKYNWNLKLISDQKYNDHVKELCREIGCFFDKHVIKRYKWQEEHTFHYERWELITSHTNRRTAITNWYKAGFQIKNILTFVGGKKSSVLDTYIKMDASGLKESVDRIKNRDKI